MKRAKGRSSIEAFLSLPDAEKEKVSAEFDREFIVDRSRPLTPEHRRQWDRIKSGFKRSSNGRGAKRISVVLEKRLLDRSDAFAMKLGISRSGLITRSLEAILARQG